MHGVELAGIPSVEQGRAGVDPVLHRGGCQQVERLRLREQRAPVQRDDALEVRRLVGKVAGERADEVVLVVARQQPVEAALEPDRRDRLLAHSRATAQRPADVARPHLGEVTERQEALQRGKEPARALFGVDCQVGPRDVADEAGEPVTTRRLSPCSRRATRTPV